MVAIDSNAALGEWRKHRRMVAGCRYQIIVNPMSGPQCDVGSIQTLCERILSEGGAVRLDFARSLAGTADLVARATAEKVAALIVFGGDGTVRSIVDAASGCETPILVVPTGTINLFAREMGLRRSVDSVLDTLRGGRIEHVDVGKANDRRFISIAGAGFDAEVIRRLHAHRTGHIRTSHYLWHSFQTLCQYRFPDIQVRVDGRIVCDGPAAIFVGNISRYLADLRLHPHALPNDGLLDVCIWTCARRSPWLGRQIVTVLAQAFRMRPSVHCAGRRIEITSRDSHVPTHLDGDPGPSLPLRIDVVSGGARVLVPQTPPHGRFRRGMSPFERRLHECGGRVGPAVGVGSRQRHASRERLGPDDLVGPAEC